MKLGKVRLGKGDFTLATNLQYVNTPESDVWFCSRSREFRNYVVFDRTCHRITIEFLT